MAASVASPNSRCGELSSNWSVIDFSNRQPAGHARGGSVRPARLVVNA